MFFVSLVPTDFEILKDVVSRVQTRALVGYQGINVVYISFNSSIDCIKCRIEDPRDTKALSIWNPTLVQETT